MKKATVDARVFADAMSKVSKVLRKSALPILEEVAISIRDGRCTLTATDLDTWITAELPAYGDEMSFVFSRTRDAMKACAHFEGDLEIIMYGEDKEDAKNWGLDILCGQRKAGFAVTSREDYPKHSTITDGVSLRVNAAKLFRRVERVRYAVQRADLNTNPQAACIQFCGDRVFSLDGCRMACDTQPDTVFPVPCLLSGFDENEIDVQIGERAVCFSSDTLKLYVYRYGANTYDPDTAIPKAYREVITVRTDEMIRELAYLKECAGSCQKPHVRFEGNRLSLRTPDGLFSSGVSMSGRGDLVI